MAELAPTPEEIRADLVTRIKRIRALRDSGLTESREEDEQAKWSQPALKEREAELQSQLDALDAGPFPVAQIRTIRSRVSKGY